MSQPRGAYALALRARGRGEGRERGVRWTCLRPLHLLSRQKSLGPSRVSSSDLGPDKEALGGLSQAAQGGA